MPRLFIAIDLPGEAKTRLSAVCSGVPGARWVKRDQMHVTLRFIGEVNEPQFEAIKTGMRTIRATQFEMRVEGVGQFPPKGAPRVLWAGLRAPDGLGKLQTQVERVARELGFGTADHPFSPHMTLARFKTRPEREDVETFFARNKAFRTAAFSVDQFVLYSSVLAREGSIYRQEAVYSLQPA